MNTLLYIKASPISDLSYSVRAADTFIDAYRAQNPADQILTIELFEKELPELTGVLHEDKVAVISKESSTYKHKAVWRVVEVIIEEFISADKYVFAIPMWNFNIPYKLKHYIDVLAQIGYTVEESPSGPIGLITGKPVFIAYARGGDYSGDKASVDFQTGYMRHILGFMGLTDIRSVIIEPTLGEPEIFKTKLESAMEQAREIALSF